MVMALLVVVADGAAVVDVNLMFRSFPTISDNKMASTFLFFFKLLDDDDSTLYDRFLRLNG